MAKAHFQDISTKPMPTLVSSMQEETKSNVAYMQRSHGLGKSNDFVGILTIIRLY
jgi:hypothetical protein